MVLQGEDMPWTRWWMDYSDRNEMTSASKTENGSYAGKVEYGYCLTCGGALWGKPRLLLPSSQAFKESAVWWSRCPWPESYFRAGLLGFLTTADLMVGLTGLFTTTGVTGVLGCLTVNFLLQDLHIRSGLVPMVTVLR